MKKNLGNPRSRAHNASARSTNENVTSQNTIINQLVEQKEILSNQNIALEGKQIDFNNLHADLSVLEDNEQSNLSVATQANNYLHQTVIARNQINPENYYYLIYRQEKIRKKVCGVWLDPKYRTVTERHFNQAAYDQDTSNANSKINQANELNQNIAEEQEKAQNIFDRAVEQVQNRIDELITQSAQISQQVDTVRQQLFNVYYSNAILMEELRMTSQHLEILKNEESKLQHKVSTLPSIIAQADDNHRQNLAQIKQIDADTDKLFLEFKIKAQNEIYFIYGLDESTRTEYLAYIYTLKQNLDSAAKKQHEILQRKIDLAECRTIDYEYLAFIAIQENNEDLLAYALEHKVDCDQTLYNGCNLLQHAIYTENDKILDQVMKKSEASIYNTIYFTQYEISLRLMLENNDLIGIKKLLDKKGVSIMQAFTAILEDSIQANNDDLKHKVLELFPEMHEHLHVSNDNIFTEDNLSVKESENIEDIADTIIKRNIDSQMPQIRDENVSVELIEGSSYTYLSNFD